MGYMIVIERQRPNPLARADALVLDAYCNREVAAALRSSATESRMVSRSLREDTRALRAQAQQIRRRRQPAPPRAGRRASARRAPPAGPPE